MTDFINTNPHRVYLNDQGYGDPRIKIGAFEQVSLSGKAADVADGTNGLVRADSEEGRGFKRGFESTGQVLPIGPVQADGSRQPIQVENPDDSRTIGMDRLDAVQDAMAAGRRAGVAPNSDRLVGDPATGAIERTPADAVAVNQPTVPYPSAGAEALGANPEVLAAGEGGGLPPEGGPYDGEGRHIGTGSEDEQHQAYESQTVPQLQGELDDRGVEYPKSARKAKLIELLEADDAKKSDAAAAGDGEPDGGAVTSADVPTRS